MSGFNRMHTDVLVIGFGGAALRAALAACARGAGVIIIGKDRIAQGGATGYAAAEVAGFNVADGVADSDDSPAEHYRDILQAAHRTAKPVLAKILAEEALQAYWELRTWGVPFEETDDHRTVAIKGCFASRPRMHIIPGHGKPIVEALRAQLEPYRPLVLENHRVADLLVHGNECIGAVAVSGFGQPCVIRSRCTVLAAGGAGQLFSPNLYPADITADGYAIAYRAGASLINMEFMQAGLGLLLPGHRPYLMHTWLWRLRPRIINDRGEEILYKYLPESAAIESCYAQKEHFPFSTADQSRYIEIAVKKEAQQAKVYLDFTRVDEAKLADASLRRLWATTKKWYAGHGCNLLDKPVEVVCVGHAVNGGVAIGPCGETDVRGLFAAGEVAGGPHGADRLGGNMLVTCQVFGRRAGEAAAEYAAANRGAEALDDRAVEEKARAIVRKYTVALTAAELEEMKTLIQKAMSENYLIVKDSLSLARCGNIIDSLDRTCKEAAAGEINPETIGPYCELQNMLQTARMMVMSAESRTESRGSHYREDYPQSDPNWDKMISVRSEQK